MAKRWRGNLGLLLINSALLWMIYPGIGVGSAMLAAEQEWGDLRIVELPYWLTFVLAIVLLVEPPLLAVLVFAFTYVLTTYWVHGNIRMPVGWDHALRRVFVTPDMHRTHHSENVRETNSNYGDMFSLWDRLFGNYVDEPERGHDGMVIGLREFRALRNIEMGEILMNPLLETPMARDSTSRVRSSYA